MHEENADNDRASGATNTPPSVSPLPITAAVQGDGWPGAHILGFLVTDREGSIVGLDPSLVAALGCPADRFIGQALGQAFPGLASDPSDGRPRLGHHRLYWPGTTGAPRTLDAWVSAMELAAGCIKVMAVCESTQAESPGPSGPEHLAVVVEQTDDLVMITDEHSVVLYVNKALERCTGYARHEIVGRKPSMLASGHHAAEFYAGLWGHLREGRPFRGTFINRRRNGDIYYESKTISPIRDPSGRITHFVSTGKDDTERVVAALALERSVRTDDLTDLPNRRGLEQHFAQLLANVPATPLAILFIDIDRFKRINDSLGHGMGDTVLREVALRLRTVLRPGDFLARVSGDEFIAVLPLGDPILTNAELCELLHRLLAAVHRPIDASPHALFVSASIGVSRHPEDGSDVATLIRRADLAMYAAKHSAHGSFRLFEAAQERTANRRLLLESAAIEALLHEELHLVFQPLWGVREGRVVALEALLRWKHPDLGMISPAEFIPIFEDTGLILEVGRWVLDSALVALARVHALGFTEVGMAVNLSPLQLHDPLLLSHIAASIETTGISPRLLEIELTESAMIDSSAEVKAVLGSLAALGVCLTLDDFGTGYSSMGTLKRMSFEALKIGQQFIWDAASDPQSRVILEAMLKLAQALHLPTTAEGVETSAHYHFLCAHACTRIQGYFVHRPAPLEAIIDFLAEPDFPPPELPPNLAGGAL